MMLLALALEVAFDLIDSIACDILDLVLTMPDAMLFAPRPLLRRVTLSFEPFSSLTDFATDSASSLNLSFLLVLLT